MTNTFSVAGTLGYQLAIEGAQYGRFGVQIATEYPVFVVIGTALPDANTPNYIRLSTDETRELVASLAATDKVYVRSESVVAVALRGYREGRT